MYKDKYISVVIPCFNEEKLIAEVLEEDNGGGYFKLVSTTPDVWLPLTIEEHQAIKQEIQRLETLRRRLVEIDEIEDGLIYGAVAGLGFSATENLFYGYSLLSEGLVVFLFLIIIRGFGGCLLHASATALTGYGYGKTIIKQKSIIRVLPFFLLAVLIHAFYNFLVSFDFIGLISGLFLALILVAISIRIIRNKIRKLDYSNR